ncbi:PD-(D/E)XK nuclease family protein [Bradyrhizobium sp. WYCCWR 12699]|uniref:PD-(D/E)XK nuclease family protein n=1 Tax=Bradyrhizobium sp. WYCCWR 12699 TaxID=3064203 RepID=UPI0028A54D66|nr:PD-(D/E)XK nuclease family protein [Bradyrhizobium sp. WYCCWR 12699]MDT4738424.1 PD-(D/E)XK nuclease family protein [Bradyrhizobium sp. WYCCWR 12699]
MVQLRTSIVGSALAFRMRRAAAARSRENGLQILTLPNLAARLAGGFRAPVPSEHLDRAIQQALAAGGFRDIEKVRHLPGMTRAVSRALRKVWDADVSVHRTDATNARLADLALMEDRVRRELPLATALPIDLRDEALSRIRHAARTIGPLTIDRLSWIAPLWRPLIDALAKEVPVEWIASPHAETAWFAGRILRPPEVDGPAPAALSCADPHHEAIESLRWARHLISTGIARPDQIAIVSAGTTPWDDHFRALAPDAGFRLAFPHGIPALSTRDGQRCAALADVLQHGLNQQRLRRLVSLCRGERSAFEGLPANWLAALPRGATLSRPEEWRRAISPAVASDPSLAGALGALPIVDMLARGISAAAEAAIFVLHGRALQLWQGALRSAPPEAIELSLRSSRFESDHDPADSVVWCSARELATAPRPHVRLLGLTDRHWPRRQGNDSIVPDHVLSSAIVDVDPVAEADRRHFRIVVDAASAGAVLSRSRRSAQGSRVGRSPLLEGRPEKQLSRARVPEHAWNEADRIMARPQDAAQIERVRSAGACWHDWHLELFTPHDGKFDADHPVVVRSIERVQSATSLRRMLTDPLGFVWRYALGWNAPRDREQPLTIAPDEFGKLVHELLRRAVDALEPVPGYARASDTEIETALANAASTVRDAWPRRGQTPPALLWRNTVDFAASLALAGLLRKEIADAGTRSWTEVPFGQPNAVATERQLPWDPAIPVAIPGTPVTLGGSIDRLDLNSSGAVRVWDYKTGEAPRNAGRMVIDGGSELQRALYGLACRQLLEGEPTVVARLLYLRGETLAVRLPDLDAAIEQIAAFVNVAVSMMRKGVVTSGRLSFDRSNELRLALPASPGYERRKLAASNEINAAISRYWSAP